MNRDSPLVQAVLKRDLGKCCNCQMPADHAHHIVPLIKNGRDIASNMVSLCADCHGAIHGLSMTNHRELTKAGLAAAKARGVKLGGIRPNTIKENVAAKNAAIARSEALRPVLEPMVARGATLRAMAEALAGAGTTTASGRALSPSSVKLHLERLGLARKPKGDGG